MCSSITYYQVAKHTFAVDCSLTELRMRENYTPFLTLATDDTIFSLQVLDDGLLPTDWQSVYTHLLTDKAEKDMPRIELYHSSEGWLLRIAIIAQADICCEILCNETFTDGTLHIANEAQDPYFCIDNALMIMYAFRTANMLTLEMHAATIVRNGLGYLFLGHSGTGKSTHARQWLQAFPDAWLLNDDNPILRIMDDGKIRVFGSPWSGKTPCYKNDSVCVKGIIKLSQAPHNKIRHISLPEAYAYILSSASGLKINPHMADGIHQTIKHIVTHMPCHQLDCLPNTQAATICYSHLAHNAHEDK
jgi:hypothetical protein